MALKLRRQGIIINYNPRNLIGVAFYHKDTPNGTLYHIEECFTDNNRYSIVWNDRHTSERQTITSYTKDACVDNIKSKEWILTNKTNIQ